MTRNEFLMVMVVSRAVEATRAVESAVESIAAARTAVVAGDVDAADLVLWAAASVRAAAGALALALSSGGGSTFPLSS